LKIDVAQLFAEGKKVPHLTAILVGNDGASEAWKQLIFYVSKNDESSNQNLHA